MKTLQSSLAVLVLAVFTACASPKEAPRRIVNTTDANAKDSVEYYATDFEVIQKNYLDQLAGKWSLQTMQRQQRLPEESIAGATIIFNRDMTFEANTSCGKVTGSYALKGTSIVFANATKNWTSCGNDEMTNAMIDLMANTVSAYTVSASQLLLRDGSSNIVFRASK